MSLAIAKSKYTGDARMGYQGDPGLFGDIFSGIGRTLAGSVPIIGGGLAATLFPRQPAVPTAGPGSVSLTGKQRFRFGEIAAGRNVSGQLAALGFSPGPGLLAAGQRAVPGGASGMVSANGMMSGYHLNKSDYFLRSGEFVPAGTRLVKNRKRNPANARATSRAISRVTQAKRYSQSLNRISIRKSKKC